MDDIVDFFEYQTAKFWIAIVAVVAIHLIPIPGEEDIAMILFRAMWHETGSGYFLLGMIAIEFIIIIVPFIFVQRFLSEKCGLD